MEKYEIEFDGAFGTVSQIEPAEYYASYTLWRFEFKDWSADLRDDFNDYTPKDPNKIMRVSDGCEILNDPKNVFRLMMLLNDERAAHRPRPPKRYKSGGGKKAPGRNPGRSKN